jgi:hypothetical protein
VEKKTFKDAKEAAQRFLEECPKEVIQRFINRAKAAPGDQSDGHDGHRRLDEPCSPGCWGCRSLSSEIWPYVDVILTEKFAQKFGAAKKAWEQLENTIFELLLPVRFQICCQIFAKKSSSWDNQFVAFSCPQLYIKFDEQVCTKGLSKLQSMPFGYDDFAYYWNDGASESDLRRISRVYVSQDSPTYQVDLSDTPVYIKDFFITPDQVGLLPPSGNLSIDAYHDDLEKELLSVLMEQRRNSHKGYEQRQERQLLPFNQGPDQSQDISTLEFKGNKRLRVRSASPVSRRQSSTPVEATQEPLRAASPAIEQPAEVTVPMETTNWLPRPSRTPENDFNKSSSSAKT